MRIFLHIALRNLLRHKRRSFLTLSAIVLGLGALIFIWSFTDGAMRQMVQNLTAMVTSDAQVVPQGHPKGFLVSNLMIEDPGPVRDLLKNEREIAGFAEMVRGMGLVSTATDSAAGVIIGIDPREESGIGRRLPIERGRALTGADEQGVLIGEPLAQKLNLELADKIIVTVQDYYGALNGDVFRLVGTFETGNSEMDTSNVVTLIRTAQKLFSLNQRISALALKVDSRYEINAVARKLRPKLAALGLSVITWEELIPMIADLIRYTEGRNLVLVLIVLAVVAVGILNTLMISIVERTREFGLMMAMGTKPKQIISLVTLESFLLTAFGSLLALLLGVGVTLYFGEVGIDLSRVSEVFSNLMIGSTVYPRIVWSHVLLSLAVIWVGNLLVSLYPAWRAGRLDPVEAMREAG